MAESTPRISVIIPTLNEQDHLPALLASVQRQRGVLEIIVSDGGSSDDTKAISLKNHANWVIGARGKGAQMNAGARIARGDFLVFLHADTILPENAFDEIPTLLSKFEAGTFCMDFDDPGAVLKWYASFTRKNHPMFLYGDQGLFLSRNTFETLGGYAELPLMEDMDIIKRIRQRGRLVKSPVCITTSARRFKAEGVLWQQCKNILMVACFRMGISPETLKKFYPYNS